MTGVLWWRRNAAALMLLMLPLLASGEPRIDYFEPISITADASRQQFAAYGYRFSLELQTNNRLIERLPAQQKPRSKDFKLYRGAVRGLPGSWVRLGRSGTQVEGAMWDGQDLYAITTYERIAPYVTSGAATSPSQPVLFRLSDTHSLLPHGFCASEQPTTAPIGDLARYKRLVRELQVAALVAPTKQLEVSMVGDGALQSEFQDATEALLIVANIVDGIFGEQVGVLIEPTDLRLAPLASDPFNSTNPENLLGQIAAFRASTPESSARGLTYLLTGKDLDGDTAGIAHLGTLCDSSMSAALGESWGISFVAGLVAAHEFGHVFGAPHDGQSGSACASAPIGFLMFPSIMNTSQFSSCSLAQMAPIVAGATCLTAPSFSDLDLEIGLPNVTPENHEPFMVPIIIRSVGTLPVHNVSLSARWPSHWLLSIDAGGGTCTNEFGAIECSFDTIGVNEVRRVEVTAVSSSAEHSQLSASIDADNDRFSSNNVSLVDIVVAATADATLSVQAITPAVLVDSPMEFTVDVTSRLTRSVRDITVTLNTFIPLQSVTTANGTCSVSGGTATCALSSIVGGASERILVQAIAPSTVGQVELQATLTGANDVIPTNNSARASVRIDPRRDVGYVQGTVHTAIVNEWTDLEFVLTSLGVEAVEDVVIDVNLLGRGSELRSVSVDSGSCSGSGFYYTCSLGTLQPGASRVITAVVRGTAADRLELRSSLRGNDQQGNNNRTTHTVYVGYGHDVLLQNAFGVQGYDGVEISTSVMVRSVGLAAAHNVATTFDIPAPSRVVNASMPGATCAAVSDQRITCTLAALEVDQSAVMTVNTITDVPGIHTGTYTVNADEDGDSTNNSRQVQLTVNPYFDIGLAEMETLPTLLVGETYDVPLRVVTGRGPVAAASLGIMRPGSSVILDSLTPSVGTCTVGLDTICEFGDLPANAEVSIMARVRAERLGTATFYMYVRPTPDAQPENNNRSFEMSVLELSNATLEVQEAVAATSGQTFEFPITVTGTSDMPRVAVEIEIPDGISVVSASASAGTCTATRPVVCTLSMRGVTRRATISLLLNAAAAGTYSSALQLTVVNDTSTDDNTRSVTLTVSAPPPPTPPPSNGGGSNAGGSQAGGGGGGAIDLYALIALLILLASRIGLASRHVNRGTSRRIQQSSSASPSLRRVTR